LPYRGFGLLQLLKRVSAGGQRRLQLLLQGAAPRGQPLKARAALRLFPFALTPAFLGHLQPVPGFGLLLARALGPPARLVECRVDLVEGAIEGADLFLKAERSGSRRVPLLFDLLDAALSHAPCGLEALKS